MNKTRHSLWTISIIVISIIIVVSCAFVKTLKEGLTNNNNVILLGDSVLNNANYVQSGDSVYDKLKQKLSNVLNLAKDGATIVDLYSQLDKIPIDLNKQSTYVFVSAGGNDILNKNIRNINDIKHLFDTYFNFIKALKAKMNNVSINVLNLYVPSNPRYNEYRQSIEQWNKLISDNSDNIGLTYNVLDMYSLINSPDDFVYDIEPSDTASSKIANLIYLTS